MFQGQLQGSLLGLQGRLFFGGLREASLKRGDLGLEFGDLILTPQDAGRCLAGGALCSTSKHPQPSENLARGRDKVPASPCPSRQTQGGIQIRHDERAPEQSRDQWRNRSLDFEHRQGSDHSFGQSREVLGRSRCQDRQRRNASAPLPIGGQVGQNLRSGLGLLGENDLQVVAQRRFDGQDVGIGDLQTVGQGSQDMLALLKRRESTGSEALVLGSQLLQDPQF